MIEDTKIIINVITLARVQACTLKILLRGSLSAENIEIKMFQPARHDMCQRR